MPAVKLLFPVFGIICFLFVACNAAEIGNATVTLGHGGQLLGKRFNLQNVDLDIFLSIPYAAPPVGKLRFRKPEKAESWTGVKDVRATNNNECVQRTPRPVNGSFLLRGEEDCLKLDITVPGGVRKGAKKAVMMWIHGGGYLFGSKNNFVGAGLAAKGDVIVVAINYRLGPLGFLTEGSGTGNYGLWDMRQALLWIQENIEEFGGDPEMVTIFGQSAGGGAVSALVMSRYTEGLFKRAIQQSGTLYAQWGWYLSANEQNDLNNATKRNTNCATDASVYTCLSALEITQLLDSLPNTDLETNPYHPTPDDDFFPTDIMSENYRLSQRFDSMIGYNADEGNGYYILYVAPRLSVDVDKGISYDLVKKGLKTTCQRLTKMSVELCVEHVTYLYELDTIADDQHRAISFIQFYTDLMFGAESLKQLQYDSQGSKRATYAYYFTEQFDVDVMPQLKQPSWLANHTADHGEDQIFVFGCYYLKNTEVWDMYYPGGRGAYMEIMANNTTEADKDLTDFIIKSWTNFAKTGDPNGPAGLHGNTPQWPQYSSASNAFMELNGQSRQVITTPNKERQEALITTLYSARRQQNELDSPQQVVSEKCPTAEAVLVQTTGENSSTRPVITSILLVTMSALWL